MEAFLEPFLNSVTVQQACWSLHVRTAAERKQPPCQSTWTDIGKWFPMITSRSTWRLWVSSRGARQLYAQQIPDQCAARQPSPRNGRNKRANALRCTWRPFCFCLHVSLWGEPATEVNVAIRKIANLLKPDKEIVHDGDHITIKTLSTFKNYNMDFYVGKEFEEDLSGVDDRKCMVGF